MHCFVAASDVYQCFPFPFFSPPPPPQPHFFPLVQAHEPSTLRHSSPKLRGLGAVGTMAPGREYRLLTGLGYCTLNLWQVRLTPGRWSPPGLHSSDHDISATTNLSATASSSTTSTTTSSTNTVSMTAEWTPIFSKNCGGQIFLTHFAFLDNCQRFLSKNNVRQQHIFLVVLENDGRSEYLDCGVASNVHILFYASFSQPVMSFSCLASRVLHVSC